MERTYIKHRASTRVCQDLGSQMITQEKQRSRWWEEEA